MPTFNEPIADADELREAARGLAHATRSLSDPTNVYAILGALSSSLSSMAQSLHQLGHFHDGQAAKTALVRNDPYHGRAASYRVSWELHRAAEMLHQVGECVDRAHEIEAIIAYQASGHERPSPRRAPPEAGLSL